MKNRLSVLLLVCVVALNYGCVALLAGAAAGTGTVWYKGKLEETVSAPVTQVHRAAKAAMRDMNITVTEDRVDSLVSELRGYLADGKKVSIDGKSTGSSTTELSIRVGTFGDKDLSLRIRDSIKRRI